MCMRLYYSETFIQVHASSTNSQAAQRASLRHTAAGIPQGGGGTCGGRGEVAGWMG